MTVTIKLNVDQMLAVHSKYWRAKKRKFLKFCGLYMQRKEILCLYVIFAKKK